MSESGDERYFSSGRRNADSDLLELADGGLKGAGAMAEDSGKDGEGGQATTSGKLRGLSVHLLLSQLPILGCQLVTSN